MLTLSNFYTGLSGLQLPVPKYNYPLEYQNYSRLSYYATFFNSIEINSSFYKIPQPSTVTKWCASVPENFKFTFKLYREITHAKNLNFNDADVYRFIETINAASIKSGCLLVQFPPGCKNENIRQLDKLLQTIALADEDRNWKVAVEFRDKGWYNEDVNEMLVHYNATLVIQDIPASATPGFLLPDTVYVRFHGPTGNYRGSYTEDFLLEYAGYITEWLYEGKSVYVYFNNTMGDAFKNLTSLNEFVSEYLKVQR
jgi:uncharacterized protein YecE (DUF72 family)